MEAIARAIAGAAIMWPGIAFTLGGAARGFDGLGFVVGLLGLALIATALVVLLRVAGILPPGRESGHGEAARDSGVV